MIQNTIEDNDNKILGQNRPIFTFGAGEKKSGGLKSKRKIRKFADPYLRAKKVNGKLYYFYRRGVDPEIYLGDADAILRAIQANKLPRKNRHVNNTNRS